MWFFRLLADLVVTVHFAYVAFVVGGMLAILVGVLLRWSWVRNFWFRAVHFAMIAVVAGEAAFGALCPLTEWEDGLRELGGKSSEPGTFLGRWFHAILFIDAPPGLLPACYYGFAAVALLAMIFAPPRAPRFPQSKKPAE
jgi:ABC-type branched-subunit amino acid transport system permease subunit